MRPSREQFSSQFTAKDAYESLEKTVVEAFLDFQHRQLLDAVFRIKDLSIKFYSAKEKLFHFGTWSKKPKQELREDLFLFLELNRLS